MATFVKNVHDARTHTRTRTRTHTHTHSWGVINAQCRDLAACACEVLRRRQLCGGAGSRVCAGPHSTAGEGREGGATVDVRCGTHAPHPSHSPRPHDKCLLRVWSLKRGAHRGYAELKEDLQPDSCERESSLHIYQMPDRPGAIAKILHAHYLSGNQPCSAHTHTHTHTHTHVVLMPGHRSSWSLLLLRLR